VTIRRHRSSLVVLLLLALSGCAKTLPAPRVDVTEDARQAVALLIERWHAFSDVRTLANIVVSRGNDRQWLQGVILARAPGSMRFEGLSPMGQPVLLVVIHNGTLMAYDVAANEVTMGPATADTAARFVSLPLEPDDLVAVLAGLAVPPRDLRHAEILPPDQDGPSLDLIGRDHRQRVWMDFETGVVKQVEISGGRLTVRITYLRGPADTLQGFDLTAAEDYVRGSVRYQNPLLDGGVELDRFTFSPPNDAKIQTIR
jgi:outer membrane lipoprotein-sorting protein